MHVAHTAVHAMALTGVMCMPVVCAHDWIAGMREKSQCESGMCR